VNFNSEIADEWVRPVSRRVPRRARAAARRCRVAAMRRGLKPLSGQRVARPGSCLARPRPPDSAASSCPPVSRPPRPRRSPLDSVPHSAPLADRRLAPHRRARHRPSPSPRAVSRRLPCAGVEPSPVHALQPAEAVGHASAAHAGHAPCGHGPRPALCVWAESDFGPVHPVKFY
jgi:hypothetical protein